MQELHDFFNENGVEAVPVSAGSATKVSFRVLDPCDLVRAQRVAARHGMRVVATSNTEFDVLGDEKDGGDEFESLVSSWKNFIQKSGDSGFRKASKLRKIASASRDSMEVARQIVQTSRRIGKSNPALKSFARKLYAALARAEKSGDSSPIECMIAALADPKETALEDPNPPAPASEPQQKLAGRVAGWIDKIYDNAYRYVLDQAQTDSWSADETRDQGSMLGEPFQAWRNSVEDVDDDDAERVWKSATDDVAHLLENEGEKAGPSGKADQLELNHIVSSRKSSYGNEIFGGGGTFQVRLSAKSLLRVVELLIEHYAARIHPEDLTDQDIKRYLKQHRPDCPFDEVKKVFDRVIKEGIPRRNADEDDDKKTARKTVTRKTAAPLTLEQVNLRNRAEKDNSSAAKPKKSPLKKRIKLIHRALESVGRPWDLVVWYNPGRHIAVAGSNSVLHDEARVKPYVENLVKALKGNSFIKIVKPGTLPKGTGWIEITHKSASRVE